MEDADRTKIDPSLVQVEPEKLMRVRVGARIVAPMAPQRLLPSATATYAVSLSGGFGGWRKPD
jgi:BarA-like signal transduction histidine kinase